MIGRLRNQAAVLFIDVSILNMFCCHMNEYATEYFKYKVSKFQAVEILRRSLNNLFVKSGLEKESLEAVFNKSFSGANLRAPKNKYTGALESFSIQVKNFFSRYTVPKSERALVFSLISVLDSSLSDFDLKILPDKMTLVEVNTVRNIPIFMARAPKIVEKSHELKYVKSKISIVPEDEAYIAQKAISEEFEKCSPENFSIAMSLRKGDPKDLLPLILD